MLQTTSNKFNVWKGRDSTEPIQEVRKLCVLDLCLLLQPEKGSDPTIKGEISEFQTQGQCSNPFLTHKKVVRELCIFPTPPFGPRLTKRLGYEVRGWSPVYINILGQKYSHNTPFSKQRFVGQGEGSVEQPNSAVLRSDLEGQQIVLPVSYKVD